MLKQSQIIPQTPINNNKQNRLLLTPTIKKIKSRNEDELCKMMLDSSFRSKKSPLSNSVKKDNNSPDTQKSPKQKNFLQALQKTKTLKEKNKHSARYNDNKDKENLNEKTNISSKRRISVNYNNNLDNSNKKSKNENSYLNILNYTKKIYENDEHLKKQMLTKKININDLPNMKKGDLLISNRMNNKNCQKKKLIISFGLNENENENPILLQGNQYKNFKSFKRKISTATKGRPSHELSKSKEKSSFSNFLKIKQKSPYREKEDKSSRHFYENNFENNLIEDNTIKNYKSNKNGDMTSKSNKFYSKAKTNKAKKLSTGKILEEKNDKNNKNKNKIKNNQKVNKTRSQKKESINSNKNQTNDFDTIKKESPKNIENKIENNITKKKKKYWFFCCFNSNSKENDSDEI